MDGSFIQVTPVSLHGQVMQDLLSHIADGHAKPGDALPTEEKLCRQYGVSRITVRRAIADLVARGLISRKRGVGSFVTAQPDGMRTIYLSGFLDEVLPFETRVLFDRAVPADSQAAPALGVAEGEAVRHLCSRVSFDGVPYTVTDSYTHLSAGPVTVGSDGKRLGYKIEKADQELDAVAADAVLAKQLGLKRGLPVMRARRTYFTEGRRPVQYFVVRYHPAHYRFFVDLVSRGGASTYQMPATSPQSGIAGG
jgi:GntR family transcriptional regulator